MKPYCYRAFDFRNRFEAPFPTVLAALNAIYSDEAYLPEIESYIVAYYEDGRQLQVPDSFHIIRKPRFASTDEATKWLLQRNTMMNDNAEDDYRGLAFGIAVANYQDPLEKQIDDAMSFFDIELDRQTPLAEIAKNIEKWILENEGLV
ncbi:hypothetical protein [Colwellia sp. MEBiC06753]